MANDASRLTDDLKILASNLRLELPVKYNSDKLLVEITRFLNLAEHKDLLYLLFMDNLLDDSSIQMIKNLMKDVKNVNIILASNDATLHSRFEIKTIIEFDKGLNEEECTNLLRYGNELTISKSEIKALTDFITPFPLVINSARLYMIIQKKTVRDYIKSFDRLRSSEKYNAIGDKDEAYRLHILESQSVPLREIKSCVTVKYGKDLWTVLMLLPYLRYHSVSSTLLSSCFFHETRNFSEKKGIVDFGIEKFLKYSLCHIIKKCRPKIRFCSNKEPEEENDGKVDRFYAFHELTMRALEEVGNEDKNEIEIEKCRINRIKLLLEMFCFEINIDSKSDDVLERNLLFLDHAKEFLTQHQTELLNCDSNEIKCYLSFLNCAIGSTLYFQRTDVELSHHYLIKARRICLEIAGDQSVYTRKMCLYLDNEHEELKQIAKTEEIRRVSNSLFDVQISTNTIKKFVLHKRRCRNEMNVIENELDNKDIKIFKSHYLCEESYAFLIEKGLAIPPEQVQKTFLHELLQRILHNNGKAFKELYYISDDDDDAHIRQACYNEFVTSNEFCKSLEEKMPELRMTPCLENNRSGRMLKRFSQPNILPESLAQDITFYEKMLESDFGFYFEFGVMKLSENSNDRHICTCLRILLRLLYKLHKLEEKEDYKIKIYEKGTIMVDKLEKKLLYIEKVNRKYMWLSFPVFYIQCGRFLQLSTEASALERGRQLFQKGTNLEESRGVSWTRYMRDGYYGQMACLKKLERHDDVETIFDKVKSKLEKTNKDYQLNDFRTLNKDVVK